MTTRSISVGIRSRLRPPASMLLWRFRKRCRICLSRAHPRRSRFRGRRDTIRRRPLRNSLEPLPPRPSIPGAQVSCAHSHFVGRGKVDFMLSPPGWLACCIGLGSACGPSLAQTEWSEPQIIERFLAQSPQTRELRARVALADAEARVRTVYANPSVSYSQEGAGFNQFFEASQPIPLSSRVRYLRQAGAAAVSAMEANRDAALWSLRSDLRISFFRMLAAQQRAGLLESRIGEVERLVRILRQREEEGEGSRYDRLRAERDLAELRTDVTTARSLQVAAGARLAAYLPEDVRVAVVSGDLAVPPAIPDPEELVRRALIARADYRVEQRNLFRYEMEQQAARRLRVPEPVVTAGVKRADVTAGTGPDPFSNIRRTGVAFGVSVPLPVWNNGRYEVARYQAEQEQASARLAVLARQIRAEIRGANDVLALRRDALAAYEREVQPIGAELIRITQTAYEEGEIGILELLDAFRLNGAAALRRLDLSAGVKEAFIELERAVGQELPAQEIRP
ncbi:MAG: hypothetical protein C5B51_29885 [Terriglobia bacterium]|nr:MAG: hypothetical protein C5B51_29885 [Terriglobia bacterium]